MLIRRRRRAASSSEAAPLLRLVVDDSEFGGAAVAGGRHLSRSLVVEAGTHSQTWRRTAGMARWRPDLERMGRRRMRERNSGFVGSGGERSAAAAAAAAAAESSRHSSVAKASVGRPATRASTCHKR